MNMKKVLLIPFMAASTLCTISAAGYPYTFVGQTLNPGQFSSFSILNNEPVVNRDIQYYNQNQTISYKFKAAATLVANDYIFEDFSSEIMYNIIASNYLTNTKVYRNGSWQNI